MGIITILRQINLNTKKCGLGSLFVGTQQVVVGRYQTGGYHDLTLTGELKSEAFSLTRELYFNKNHEGGQRFVTRLWARKKIDDLLNMIEMYGEQQELIQAVIALSIRYQILTPYTAFYVDPTRITEEMEKETIGKKLVLFSNFPNPFNLATTIRFYILSDENYPAAYLDIYNINGEKVRTYTILCNQSSGFYEINWDGKNDSGEKVCSGIYLYRLSYGAMSVCKRMTLIK